MYVSFFIVQTLLITDGQLHCLSVKYLLLTKSINLSTIISTRELYLGKTLTNFFKFEFSGIIVFKNVPKALLSPTIYRPSCGAAKLIKVLLGLKSPATKVFPIKARVNRNLKYIQ